MKILIPLFFFTALVLLLPHGTLETIAVIGVGVTGGMALWQVFGKPRRRRIQPRQLSQRPRVAAKPRATTSPPAAPRRSQPVPVKRPSQTIEIIYIGERFYRESGTEMGALYEIDSRGNWERHTLSSFLSPVEHGAIVGIRKATPQEMTQAEQMLASILRTQASRRQGDL